MKTNIQITKTIWFIFALNIPHPKFSLFADDNLYVVKAAVKAGIENSFQVLEPTSDGSIINEPKAILTIRNIGDLI